MSDAISGGKINIEQILTKFRKHFDVYYPSTVRLLAMSMPAYLEANDDRFPERMEGMLDTVNKLNALVEMRARVMLKVLSTSPKLFDEQNAQLMTEHLDDDLTLIDSQITECDVWIRVWSFMLQSLTPSDQDVSDPSCVPDSKSGDAGAGKQPGAKRKRPSAPTPASEFISRLENIKNMLKPV